MLDILTFSLLAASNRSIYETCQTSSSYCDHGGLDGTLQLQVNTGQCMTTPL